MDKIHLSNHPAIPGGSGPRGHIPAGQPSRYSGDYRPLREETRPGDTGPIMGMLETLKKTFDSLSELKGTQGNYDPQTKRFSIAGGGFADKAGKVSKLGKSFVTGLSKRVYSYNESMVQGFDEILRQMEAIKYGLCDPSVSFNAVQIQDLESSFMTCFNSIKLAVDKIKSIQRKADSKSNNQISDRTQAVLAEAEKIQAEVYEKFLERRVAIYKELVGEVSRHEIDENNQLPPVDRAFEASIKAVEYEILGSVHSIQRLRNRTDNTKLCSKVDELYAEYNKLNDFMQNHRLVEKCLRSLNNTTRDLAQLPKPIRQPIQQPLKRILNGLVDDLNQLSKAISVLSEHTDRISPDYLEKVEQIKQMVITQFLQLNHDLMSFVVQSFQNLDSNVSVQQLEQNLSCFKETSRSIRYALRGPHATPEVKNLIDTLRFAESEWRLDCNLQIMQYISTQLTDPNTKFKDQLAMTFYTAITDLDKILRNHQRLCESNRVLFQGPLKERLIDLVARVTEARVSTAVLYLERTVDLIERTIEKLWDDVESHDETQAASKSAVQQSSVIRKLLEQRQVLQKFLDKELMDAVPTEDEEMRKAIEDVTGLTFHTVTRLDDFLKNSNTKELENGKKIILRQYGQTADAWLDAIETLVQQIGERSSHDLSLPDELLLRVCVEKFEDLRYELNDSEKIDAFYKKKEQVLRSILEIQENKQLVNDALLTKEALENLADDKQIDQLDQTACKRKGMVVFEVAGQYFKIDQKTLMKYSKVMKKMLQGNFKERPEAVVSLIDIDPTDFRAFVDYINWKKIPGRKEPEFYDPNAYLSLWYLAERFDVGTLKTKCIDKVKELSTLEDLLPLHADELFFRDLVETYSTKDLYGQWIPRLQEILKSQNRILKGLQEKKDVYEKDVAECRRGLEPISNAIALVEQCIKDRIRRLNRS